MKRIRGALSRGAWLSPFDRELSTQHLLEQSELGSKEMTGENGSSEELVEDESGEEDTRELSAVSLASGHDEVGIASHTTQYGRVLENRSENGTVRVRKESSHP